MRELNAESDAGMRDMLARVQELRLSGVEEVVRACVEKKQNMDGLTSDVEKLFAKVASVEQMQGRRVGEQDAQELAFRDAHLVLLKTHIKTLKMIDFNKR